MKTSNALLTATAGAGVAVASQQCKTAGVPSLTNLAQDLLVNGQGTSISGNAAAPAWFAASSVETIDRELGISVNLPSFTIDGTGYYASTTTDESEGRCDRKWTCAKQDYKVCPGQHLTTAQFRSFTTDTLEGQGAVGPTFDFTTTDEKKYSLIMIDLLSKSFTDKAQLLNLENKCFFHYLGLNVDDAAGLNNAKGDEPMGPLRAAGNLNTAEPNQYTFLLFEHDHKLEFDNAILSNQIASCDLNGVLAHTGLEQAKLVSINNFQGEASIIGRTSNWGTGMKAALGPFGTTCENLGVASEEPPNPGSELDMCTPSVVAPVVSPCGVGCAWGPDLNDVNAIACFCKKDRREDNDSLLENMKEEIKEIQEDDSGEGSGDGIAVVSQLGVLVAGFVAGIVL